MNLIQIVMDEIIVWIKMENFPKKIMIGWNGG
jgi:hypothetical protein